MHISPSLTILNVLGFTAPIASNAETEPILSGSTYVSLQAKPKKPQEPPAAKPKEDSKPKDRIEDPKALLVNDPDLLPLKSTPFGEIDYVRTGNPEGPTLLLAPGKFGSWYEYHLLAIELAERGYDVMAVSQPTHGNTKNSSGKFDFFAARPSLYGEFWSHWITEMDLSDVTVVGSSYGLAEVMEAVLQNEELPITGFVSINGYAPRIHPEPIAIGDHVGLLGGHRGPGWYMKEEGGEYGNLARVIATHFSNVGESLMHRGEEGERLMARLMQSFPIPDRETGEFDRQRVHDLCVQAQSMMFWNVVDQMDGNEKPDLKFFKDKPFLLIGTHDHMVRGHNDKDEADPKGYVVDDKGKTYAQRLGKDWDELSSHPVNQIVQIPEAHHMVYVTHPEQTADAIDAFMKAVKESKQPEGEQEGK